MRRPRPTPIMLRQGFNLVEAAIVLAIVGLVIGGIWVAASAARLSFQVAEMQKAILQSCQSAGQLVPTSLVPSTLPGGWMRMNTKGINMGIFPKSWKLTTTPSDDDYYIQTDIGYMTSRIFDQASGPPGGLDMMFTMPQAICARLARSLAGMNMSYYKSGGVNSSPLSSLSVWTCTSDGPDALSNCVMQPSQGAATLFQFGATDIDAVVNLCSKYSAVSFSCHN